MKRFLVLRTALFFLSYAAANGAILDQYQYWDNGATHFHETYRIAQTFTCEIVGQLAYVSIELDTWGFSPPSFPTTVSIVETYNGIPNGSVLGAVTATVPSVGQLFQFDFSAESVNLSAGSQYGIVVSNNDNIGGDPTDGLRVQFSDNKYAGGELWKWKPATGWEQFTSAIPGYIIGDADMSFDTWMTPIPEPATLSLFALGAVLLKRKR